VSVHVGSQLVLVEPTPELSSEVVYYLLASAAKSSATSLCWFVKGQQGWVVHLTSLTRTRFESLLLSGQLKPKVEQQSTPPWNASLQGLDLQGMEDLRRRSKRTLRSYATQRFEAISPLLDADVERRIQGSADPEHVIRRQIAQSQARKEVTSRSADDHAKEAPEPGPAAEKTRQPKQNATRILLWYCTYILFGRCLEALVPAFSEIGKWDRQKRAPDSPRLGRPKKNPRERVGHSALPLRQQIIESYVKRAGVKKGLAAIYRRALREDFGCRTEKLEDGQLRAYHAEGRPFPSYQQFRYHVLKEFSLETVQRSRLGDAEYRKRHGKQKGSFSEEAANFCERVEEDCYHVKERPRQLLSEEPGPPLVVCKLVCTTSAHTIGIGFSYGSERAEAYKLAKFCAAVPKSLMGRLFGIPIADEDWLGAGLPARCIDDRGPGASDLAYGEPDVSPAIRELALSYSGQSKATVEASHPRTVQVSGEPIHQRSNLNVFLLARRELLSAKTANHSADASKRLTPDMIVAGVAANPASIARYLIDRGRNDELPVPIDRAIREFLRPVDLSLRDDGLWLGCLKFRTGQEGESFLGTMAKGQCAAIKGFIYPLSLMLGWIELRGKLFEVRPILRIRDDQDQFQLTLEDLPRLEEKLRQLRANQRENSVAQRMLAEETFLETTGVDWHSGSVVRGAAPSTAESKEWVPTVGKVA
jgi:hypothetical protein